MGAEATGGRYPPARFEPGLSAERPDDLAGLRIRLDRHSLAPIVHRHGLPGLDLANDGCAGHLTRIGIADAALTRQRAGGVLLAGSGCAVITCLLRSAGCDRQDGESEGSARDQFLVEFQGMSFPVGAKSFFCIPPWPWLSVNSLDSLGNAQVVRVLREAGQESGLWFITACEYGCAALAAGKRSVAIAGQSPSQSLEVKDRNGPRLPVAFLQSGPSAAFCYCSGSHHETQWSRQKVWFGNESGGPKSHRSEVIWAPSDFLDYAG